MSVQRKIHWTIATAYTKEKLCGVYGLIIAVSFLFKFLNCNQAINTGLYS